MLKKLLITSAAGWYLSDAERRQRLRTQVAQWVESSAGAAQEKLGADRGSESGE